jgi:D-alanyl-D-alanine carboxypeptidase
MADQILRRYAIGGAQRPDSFSGLSPEFASSLAALFQNAPSELQGSLKISSGFRSPERQAQLYQAAVAKYGSEEAARKWVAPPGRSNHNKGQAVDLKFLSPAAQAWMHKNAGPFNLVFPMKHEPWHIEPVGARGAQSASNMMQAGTGVPMMAQYGAAQPVTAGFQMSQNEPMPTPIAIPMIDTPSPIANMFAADTAIKQQRELADQAEKTRLAALFSPDPFG